MSAHDEMHDVLTDRSLPRTRACAGADLDLDLTPRATSGADLPPHAPNDETFAPKNEKSACCDAKTELARVKQAVAVDIENLQADVIAKNREIARLKRELSDVIDEESPDAAAVKALLKLWHTEIMGGDKRVKADLKSTRAPKVRKALKRRGVEMCQKAILGCKYDDWAMGRVAKSGGKAFNDIAEHILHTDGDIEKFAKLYDKHHTDDEPDAESLERQFVRHVYDDDCELPHRSADKEPKRRSRSVEAPIDKVLGALHARGLKVVAYQAHADQWSAQCPAHDDRDPSLAVHRKPDGQVLLSCFAGCVTNDVLAELGLDWRDLWEDADRDVNRLDGPRERTIPSHLRSAMQQMLDVDRSAA